MGQDQIIGKLRKELKKEIHDELQVVWILSRVRKILEIRNQKGKYKFLKLYCNWVLHTKIERTEPIADELQKFIEGQNDDFWNFNHLISDLEKFLKEYSLSQKILKPENYARLENLLLDIYSDTPVKVHLDKKVIITLNKHLGKHGFEIRYE